MPSSRLRFPQRFSGGIALGGRKRYVKRNHTRAAGAQFIDQCGVILARQGKRINFLQGLFVNAHDDDAIVMRARAAHFEAQIQRTLFDALQECETGARINGANPGKSEQHQPQQSDQHAQTQVNVVERESS